MASETVKGAPVRVTPDELRDVRHVVETLERLHAVDGSRPTTLVTADGQVLELAQPIVAALHALVSWLARGDDVVLAPVLPAPAADVRTDHEDVRTTPNPYLAAAGMFADDSFADEVDAYIAAERQRERAEAAREAGD